MANFDPKALTRNEWGVVGGAVVAFVGLFFHAYGASVSGFSASVSGWHFAGLWIPVLLLLAVAGTIPLQLIRPGTIPAGVAPVLPPLRLVLAVLAVIIELIRWVSYPDGSGIVDAGASFGTYLIVVASIVAAVFGFFDFTAKGGKVQDFKNYLPQKPSDPSV